MNFIFHEFRKMQTLLNYIRYRRHLFQLLLFFSAQMLYSEGTVEGKLTLKDPSGKVKVDASNCYVYVFGKNYIEKGEGKGGEIVQKGKKFIPRSIAITHGQELDFPNQDPIYHNIFSNSSALEPRLDLGHYKSSSKNYQFKKPGNYQIFCNIHPEMTANILVLPNKAFARVKPDGIFKIENVKNGSWVLAAWSPLSKKVAKAMIEIKDDQMISKDLVLVDALPEVPEHTRKDGSKYKDY